MSNATTSQLGVIPEDTGTTQGSDSGQAQAQSQQESRTSVRTEEAKPNAPQPESQKGDSIVDFADFQAVLGEVPLDTGTVDDKSKTTTKTDDKQKQETQDKIDDKSKQSEQQAQQQVPDKSKEAEEDIAEVSADIRKGQKDYSGLNEEEIKIFRRMSQKTFEHLKPIYLQHKEQKIALEQQKIELEKLRSGAIPDSYFQHPRAYTLTPAFEKAANTFQKAQMIVQHWEDQLAKLNSGDEEYQEIHVDPSSGDLYLGKPVKATKASIGEVGSYLAKTQAQLQNVGAHLQSLGQTHATKVDADVKQIKEFENASFPHFNTEEGKKLAPLIKDTITKVLPESHYNNPLAEAFAKAILTIQQFGVLVKKLQEGKGAGATQTNSQATSGNRQTTQTQTNAQKAGPTNASMAAAGGGSNGGEVDYSQFLEVMGGKR